MNRIEEQEWISTLKVGDKICYKTNWNGYVIDEILKITPTGQIKTKLKRTFKNGWCRIDSWEIYHLQQVTEDIRNEILFNRLVEIISKTNFKKYSLETLKEIFKIINRGAEDDETTN